MIVLKEDDSSDIKRINKLLIKEDVNVIEGLTESQQEYYNSKLPIRMINNLHEIMTNYNPKIPCVFDKCLLFFFHESLN